MSAGRRLLCTLRTLLFAVLLAGGAGRSMAFGELGHRLIGGLAQPQLSPVAATEVKRLLDGQSLAQIAPWADEIRETRGETAPWHYINMSSDDCSYQPALDCPQGNCLPAVLQKQMTLLTDRSRSTAQRGEALRFVVHLFGDLHQPLHLGFASDKGGNTFQIALDRRKAANPPVAAGDARALAQAQWWQQQTRGYNLHSMWDRLLLQSHALDETDYLDLLRALPATPNRDLRRSVVQIAQQSCRIMRGEGFYPPAYRIGRDYVRAQRPVVDAQLRLAGDRLAVLLNTLLDP